jgi:hypothetical protein
MRHWVLSLAPEERSISGLRVWLSWWSNCLISAMLQVQTPVQKKKKTLKKVFLLTYPGDNW